MIFKKALSKGVPNTTINAWPFSMSVIQSLTVCLLKPNFSSRTNVL